MKKSSNKRSSIRIGIKQLTSIVNNGRDYELIKGTDKITATTITIVDISTGEFRCFTVQDNSELQSFLDRIDAKEIILPYDEDIEISSSSLINKEYFESISSSESELKRHFRIASLNSFGIQEYKDAFPAAWAALSYIKATQKNSLLQITKLSPVNTQQTLYMDPVTLKNLELTESLHEKGRKGTLFWVLNF